MRIGTRAAMHYITEEHDRIIGSIKRCEKKAINEYNELVNARESMKQSDNEIVQKYLQETSIPASLEEACPCIVVKKWPSVLSVFPIMLNNWHWGDYQSWIYFYSQPKHLAQKYAALMVMEDEHEIECVLWSKGKAQKEWKIYADNGMEFGKNQVRIDETSNGEILNEWLKYIPEGFEKNALASLPLLLTSDWSEKWSIVKKTRLACFCE